MEPVKLPPLDPEVLALLALIGAIVGSIATVGGYIATKAAESIGEQVNILPRFPEVKR